MNLLKLALFICFMITSQLLAAVEVDGLFETEVIAKNNEEKSIAIRKALQRVLTRVLAGDNVFNNETVKTVLANAEYYVNEHQYSLAPAGNVKQKNSRVMRVKFNEQLLVDTFRPGNIGLWNEVRPNTLIWLVVEQNGTQRFFDAETMPEIELAFEKAARVQGIPVLFPIDDLQEKQSLSPADVLSAYSEYLLNVSQRYDVVSTLAGKIARQGQCWKAEWTLYFDSKIRQWNSECLELQDVALNGFQGVYDWLSKYYSVKPDLKTVDSVILKVSHLHNQSQLIEINRYLSALPMVKTVTWTGIKAKHHLYRVFFQGSREDLNDRLKNDKVIRIEDVSLINANEVRYQFLSK